MSTPVVQLENISKRYFLNHQSGARDGLRYSLEKAIRSPVTWLRGLNVARRQVREEFWALKNVSFDVHHGEVLGVIGRNGAGKSTLLKILSRITEPTGGRVSIDGRVASLLEVGTGFHPELTGRENIFLNGAILGMSRLEIKKKFDEIVAFAEVEKFIDTPVKRYSSGMYVRLAFAVAAHLEPEILIIDEVLAVGDVSFQKKCLGKMGQVAREGRTILFVSHNMNAVESLCHRVVYLESGQVKAVTDDVRSALTTYLTQQSGDSHPAEWSNGGNLLKNSWFQPLRFYVGDKAGSVAAMPIRNDDDVFVYIVGIAGTTDAALNVGYAVYEGSTLLYWTTSTDGPEDDWPTLQEGTMAFRAQLPKRLLNEGTYRLELLISLHFREWVSCPGENAPKIELSVQGGLSDSPYWTAKRPGMIAPVCNWELHDVQQLADRQQPRRIATENDKLMCVRGEVKGD